MSEGIPWISPTRKCAACGTEFARYAPTTTKPRQSGLLGGAPYCKRCHKERSDRYQSAVIGTKKCAFCGEEFPWTRRKQYQHKSKARCCGKPACVGRSHAKYAINPLGVDICRAPGGCDRKREGADPLCCRHQYALRGKKKYEEKKKMKEAAMPTPPPVSP